MSTKDLNNFKELKNSSLQENSFEVPEDYFNSLEDTVLAKLRAEVLYKNETSEIPNDYFDQIENNILQKIKPKGKVISLRSRILKIATPIAVAASILLAVVLTNNSKSVTFDSLTNADIENWIQQETINETEIASIFLDEELTDFYLETDISDSDMLDYLNENEIENLIYEN